jgi:hypothetical protein
MHTEKYVKNVLNCCGFHVDIGLRVLLDKSLISIEDEMIVMHNLLEELGRKIVQENSRKVVESLNGTVATTFSSVSGGFAGGSRATTFSIPLCTSLIFTLTSLLTASNLSDIAVTIVSDPKSICLMRFFSTVNGCLGHL